MGFINKARLVQRQAQDPVESGIFADKILQFLQVTRQNLEFFRAAQEVGQVRGQLGANAGCLFHRVREFGGVSCGKGHDRALRGFGDFQRGFYSHSRVRVENVTGFVVNFFDRFQSLRIVRAGSGEIGPRLLHRIFRQ